MKRTNWSRLTKSALVELTKDLRRTYPITIVEAFQAGMAQLWATAVWKAVDSARGDVPTERTIRGLRTKMKGLSQEQLADMLGKTQGTVSKWLSGKTGASTWSNMVLAMAFLEFGLEKVQFPSKRETLREGLATSLFQLKRKEFGDARVLKPSGLDIEYLSSLYDPQCGWISAKCIADENVRQQEMQKAVKTLNGLIVAKVGSEVRKRSVEEISELERVWGGCWHIATACVPEQAVVELSTQGGG